MTETETRSRKPLQTEKYPPMITTMLNRIVKLVNKGLNSTISSYEYSYYLDGSDVCKVTEENGIIETTEYEYDGLKRLTNEEVKKGNTTDTYSYEYDDYGTVPR